MKTHNIPLESFTPKGKTKIKLENGELHIPVEKLGLDKSRHHVYVPGKYKLPFRIDMKAKINFVKTGPSQFTLYIGKGRIYFNEGRTCTSDILADIKGVMEDSGSPYYILQRHT